MIEVIAGVVAVALIATSQLLFKRAALRAREAKHTLIQWPVLLGLAANGVAAACWVFALRRMELNHAFPLLSLNYILVPLGARWFFGEQLGGRRLLAIVVIMAGVLIAVSAA